MNIVERLLGPIRKGGTNNLPPGPRPVHDPKGQTPLAIVDEAALGRRLSDMPMKKPRAKSDVKAKT